MSDPTVTVIGSYNVGFVMVVPRFPVPGETVIGENFGEGPGGKGSNQAIAAARLGAQSTFIGKIGTDRYGDDALELWEAEGVDTDTVIRTDDTHSGVGFVIVNEEGENEITVAPGANDQLGADSVAAAGDSLQASDAVLAQLEVPDEPLIAAGELAQEADVPFILNPAPARELPESLLSTVSYLTPNQNEARVMVGREPDDPVDDRTVAEELLDLGVETVVITRGEAGAVMISADEFQEIPAPEVDVTDTTGAGDAFNGALAVALAEGREPAEAIEFACAGGAHAVTEMEVIPGLPTREELETVASDD